MRAPVVLAWLVLIVGCVGPDAPVPYHEQVLGGDPFTELVVEIDHAPEHAPSVAAREHLVEQLRAVTSKSKVSIGLDASLSAQPGKVWSAEDLVALERSTRSREHAAPVAVLHVLYPSGTYREDGVVGITISGDGVATIAVFLDKMAEFDPGMGTPLPYPPAAREEVEKATLLHEAGHAMGLVNNGLPMVRPHEDPESPGHSNNRESIMWVSVDQVEGIRAALLGESSLPLYFDADDRADMRAVGGR